MPLTISLTCEVPAAGVGGDLPHPLMGRSQTQRLSLPRWLPRAFAAGEDWDAVRVTGVLAPLVLATMMLRTQSQPGPVVIDAQMDAHYWLIPHPGGHRWDFAGVRLLSRGSWVVLPALARPGRRVRWLARPDDPFHLADPATLHATLTDLTAP